MFGYESRESGREIIPGMHIWAQLGIYGGVLGPSPPLILPSWANGPPISLRGILTYMALGRVMVVLEPHLGAGSKAL